MPGVRARLARHVEDTAPGAPHLRVVGGDLDLDFFHRLERWDDHRAVPDVDDRDAVERVVVPAPGSASELEQRGVRLVLLSHELRVARVGDPGRDGREEERVAARRGQGLDGLLVEGAAHRGVRGLEGHSPCLDGDLLLELADLEREIHGDELLGPDADPLVLDGLEALHRDLDRVGAGLDLHERIFAGAVGGGSSDGAVGFVEKRHLGAGHHSPRLAHRAAQPAVIRLRQQGHGGQDRPAHQKPVPPPRHRHPLRDVGPRYARPFHKPLRNLRQITSRPEQVSPFTSSGASGQAIFSECPPSTTRTLDYFPVRKRARKSRQ